MINFSISFEITKLNAKNKKYHEIVNKLLLFLDGRYGTEL